MIAHIDLDEIWLESTPNGGLRPYTPSTSFISFTPQIKNESHWMPLFMQHDWSCLIITWKRSFERNVKSWVRGNKDTLFFSAYYHCFTRQTLENQPTRMGYNSKSTWNLMKVEKDGLLYLFLKKFGRFLHWAQLRSMISLDQVDLGSNFL